MSKINDQNCTASRNLFGELIFTYMMESKDDAKTEIPAS